MAFYKGDEDQPILGTQNMSTLERLWILNTYDGAGLYVHFVCESSLRNLRMEMNGNGNRFENEVAGSAVHILGDGERSSENAIVSDNVFAGAAGEAIQIEPRSTGAIEVHGNVFAGRYGNQPIRR